MSGGKVLRNFLLAIFLVVALGVCHAGTPLSDAARTVEILYRDYSWEATMIGDPGVWIGAAPRPILEKYFDSELAGIWIRSRQCNDSSCDPDWIAYDPLWDSMDAAGFYYVTITPSDDPHMVKVEMNAPCGPGTNCKSGDDVKVHLTYLLKQTAKGWRITDIRSDIHGSLKAQLLKQIGSH